MVRCLVCGCSRLDARGFGICTLCGGASGLRTEQCYITEDTKAKLLANADELKTFGITLEEQRILGKSVDPVGAIGLALAVAESLNSGVLRKLVLFLRDINIPDTEILRLRLDEPEQVLNVLKGEDKTDNGTHAG